MLNNIFAPEEQEKYRNIRKRLKIKSKVLYSSTTTTVASNADGERIKIPAGSFALGSDIAVYGDTVRIISMGQRLSAVLIKDEEVAKTVRTMFEFAWQAANKK